MSFSWLKKYRISQFDQMEKWNYLDFSEWQYNNNVHFEGIVAISGPRIQGSQITKMPE